MVERKGATLIRWKFLVQFQVAALKEGVESFEINCAEIGVI